MKTILTVSIFFITCFTSLAVTRTAVGNSGQGWNNASNWNPVGVPQNGDTVNIPAGLTLSVKTNIYNNTPNLVIRVHGTLNFSSGGKLDLGNNSKIIVYTTGRITTAGTPSETIKIGNVTKYKGNSDGTIVGPAYTDSFSGVSPSGFSLSILPVKFQSFMVKLNGLRQAQLNWTVSDESQIAGYTVEKSTDARTWKQVNIQAANNSSQSVKTYSETDSFLSAGTTYYRVKAEGNNGETFYSKTELVEQRSVKGFTIYPNPVSSKLRMSLDPSTIQGAVTITLYSSNSTKIEQLHYDRLPANVEMNVSHLPKGMYRVVLTDAAGTKQDQSVIIY